MQIHISFGVVVVVKVILCKDNIKNNKNIANGVRQATDNNNKIITAPKIVTEKSEKDRHKSTKNRQK